MRLAFVIVAAVAGASVLAWQHPAPSTAYQAAGTLVVPAQGSPANEVAVRTRQLGALLAEPSIVSQAREEALQSSSPASTLEHLNVHVHPDAGVVGYSVRASSRSIATQVAADLAGIVVQTLQNTSAGSRFGVAAAEGFDAGFGAWRAVGATGHVAALTLVPHGPPGGRALRVVCDASRGCGIVNVVGGAFPAGRPLTFSVLARATRPAAVILSARASVNDGGESPETIVGRTWRRLVFSWHPKHDESSFTLSLVDTGAEPIDVKVDDAFLVQRPAPLPVRRELAVLARLTPARATPVQIVSVNSGRTLRWAVYGAVGGAVVGLAGVAAFTMASRRRAVA